MPGVQTAQTLLTGITFGEQPRVREGGEVLQTVELDRGCFACALGGAERTTLFTMATVWNGPSKMFKEPRTGQVRWIQAPAPGAGWP